MSTAYSTSISVGGLGLMSGVDTEVGNAANQFAQLLPFAANSNSVAISGFAFNASGSGVLQGIFLLATMNCTINTNNSSSPTNTINLIANQPLWWGRSPGYFANPVNANTNAAFLSCNAGGFLSGFILTS